LGFYMNSQDQSVDLSCLPSNRKLYYGGAWHVAAAGNAINAYSPSTGHDLGAVQQADTADIDKAVVAAHAAFALWRDTPAQERARTIRRAAVILGEHAKELAYLEALNVGISFQAMLHDVKISAEYMEYFAGLVVEMKGDTIPISPDVLNYTVREPLGVVARIGAFNHPALYVGGKCAAPLAAGNTLVIKPADLTPLSALRIAELWDGIFPPGVFNVVPGGREAGVALAEHPLVSKIGFIGSPGAGRAVMKSASATLKKLTLELGGKNAMIGCEDVEPGILAKGIVKGMNFRYATGQSCNSTSRIFLHDKVYDAVLPELVKEVAALKIGLPMNPATDMGCMTGKAQFEKSMSYISLGQKEGARLLYGGKRPSDPELADGFFIEPTVFVDVTDDMRIAREEIFGPVVSVLRWSDERDVIDRVNAVEYGLTGSIWTHDLDRAHRLASRMQAGYIWINDAATHHVGVPFGGYKQSGMGREESIEELLACTQIKNVNLKFKAEH
jgi:betaine-aldehyde dehydrogenase